MVDEAVERIRVAEKAADRIASEELRAILENLDAYLLERVRQARSS